jgi:hypothetical protein
MTMILLNDLVQEGSEGVVGVVGAGIDAYSRLGPFGAGEDGLLEGEAVLVLGVFELIPDFLVQTFGEVTVGTGWEVGEFFQILWCMQVGTTECSFWIS